MVPDREAVRKRRALLEEEMRRAVAVLRDMGAETVISFGSMAEGRVGPFSDVDLIAVIPGERRFLDRLREAFDAIAPRVAMDLLIYTPDEFSRMKEENAFLARALEGGMIVHGKSS